MLKVIRNAAFVGLIAAPLTLVSSATVAQTASVSAAVTAEWSTYMTPDSVFAVQSADTDVQIIDIRSQKYVKRGTIPGAVWIPFASWRGVDGQARRPIVADDLATLLGDSGIDLAQPIVVHNHSGNPAQAGRAAIVYWILKTAGADDIAILNGGFKAWRAMDLPEADLPSTRDPVSIEVSYSTEWWADPMDIFSVTSGQKDGAILDARLDGQVRKSVETGKPLMSMPLAQYIPASFFMNHLSEENLSAPAQSEFRTDLEARGIDLGEGMLISVCQTGELSALSWFYASEIVGIDNVRYYPDALRGWEGDGGRMFGMNAALPEG